MSFGADLAGAIGSALILAVALCAIEKLPKPEISRVMSLFYCYQKTVQILNTVQSNIVQLISDRVS